MTKRARLSIPDRIGTDRDLDQFWRALMGPLGFGSRRLWLVVVGPDDEPIKQVMRVDDLPLAFDEREADNVMAAFGAPLLEQLPGGSLAILFSRPGRHPMQSGDRRLAWEIARAAARAKVALRPVYFANDVQLRVFAGDDLLGDQPASSREPH